MTPAGTHIGTIRYNPAEAAFEALVTLVTPQGPTRLPVRFPAPLTASDAVVHNGLLRAAFAAQSRPGGLRLRMTPDVAGAAFLRRAA